MKFAPTVGVVGCLLLAACSTNDLKTPRNTCSVAPPNSINSDRSAALEAAADLTKFAAMPISANVKAEAKSIFESTFQKVPDPAAACAMLNQTYVCIQDRQRAVEYMEFMRSTGQCNR